jgi:hypothetical protein
LQKISCGIYNQRKEAFDTLVSKAKEAVNKTVNLTTKKTANERMTLNDNEKLTRPDKKLIRSNMEHYFYTLKTYYEMKRTNPKIEYKRGDEIVIDNNGFFRTPQINLKPRYVGPFKKNKQLNDNAFEATAKNDTYLTGIENTLKNTFKKIKA